MIKSNAEYFGIWKKGMLNTLEYEKSHVKYFGIWKKVMLNNSMYYNPLHYLSYLHAALVADPEGAQVFRSNSLPTPCF